MLTSWHCTHRGVLFSVAERGTVHFSSYLCRKKSGPGSRAPSYLVSTPFNYRRTTTSRATPREVVITAAKEPSIVLCDPLLHSVLSSLAAKVVRNVEKKPLSSSRSFVRATQPGLCPPLTTNSASSSGTSCDSLSRSVTTLGWQIHGRDPSLGVNGEIDAWLFLHSLATR